MGVPGRPDPPVLEKATHHSIELSWHHPPHPPEQGRLRYCVQEEDASRKDGFGTVYKYVVVAMFIYLPHKLESPHLSLQWVCNKPRVHWAKCADSVQISIKGKQRCGTWSMESHCYRSNNK